MAEIKKLSDNLYWIVDSCNVYILKDGDAALLIDAGSGSVIDHIDEIGCKHIEWVLHTHIIIVISVGAIRN